MKRIFDIILVCVVAVFLLPLALLVALLVRLTSKGPALYWPNRVGINNDIFKIQKFRSMLIDTPSVATHLLDNPGTYLSPIGGFLCLSSLDELPQLLSVLKCGMSFVLHLELEWASD
jgi:O-antigen biosynthesis protein WbqP